MSTRVLVVNRGEPESSPCTLGRSGGRCSSGPLMRRCAYGISLRRAAPISTTRSSSGRCRLAVEAALAEADEVERPQRRVELADLRATVRSEKLGDVANEFEQVHNVERALAVGSVHAIVPARELRPYLIGAVERGISRTAPDTPTAAAP